MKRYIKLLACIMGIILFLGIGSLSIFSLQVEATSETELLRIAISHLKEDVSELEEEIEVLKNNPAADGVGISTIEQTATSGNMDTYTITLTDGTTYDFVIKNGQNGRDGTDGKDGVDGKDGTDGKDGVNGKDGINGKDGVGISTIEQTASEGNENIYTITLTDGNSYDFIVQNGLDGKDGKNTVSQVASNGETSSDAGTIAMIIALISMLGTVIMGICLVKSGNFKSKNVSERGF